MATQELVVQLEPEHYDNLTDANATGKTNFGKSSCQNNTGTVFAVGSDDNVVVYTSNSYATKYATSISNPGNSNSLFGFKIAMDSPGDTIIIGAPGDNRVYVFDAQNQARTSWTQRSSGWSGNSYLGTSSSVNYGADVDVAGDDDSLFVVGRPGDHKIELWSWPNGSSATLLKTITKSSYFGFSCKLSADGQVVIAGGPGNYYPYGTNNAYDNGIAHVYAKDPSSATTWTERTLPFDYTDVGPLVNSFDMGTTTVKRVTNTNAPDGGTRTDIKPAFGFSVAINKDGTFIAVSAPNRKCFFSAEWINGSSYYKWLTGKPITGDIDEFGSFLFMQYDGTRIITGNTSVENKMYYSTRYSYWDDVTGFTKSYCILDWNGIYYTNYSETFNLYSFGKIPTSMSKNGEFCLFSANYNNGSFIGNEARVTGSNRTLYTGNTVFSLTRFAPTIKILGTTVVGGDLKVRFLSVGGDKSYISSNTSAGFVPGYINFENTRDEHSIFRSQIINTSQYTGDDNLSELLLFKSGHVRGLNSRGPDRIRLKSPSIILEGMTSENHPLYTSPNQIGSVAESWSRYLKESSAVYSRLTLTGIGNVGIGIPEYADHIIKENWNLGSSPVLGDSDYYKQNENANAQAPPLINHRLVIDGTQSIQNGKLYINNPTSSNLITDGMATCYNTMTSACIQNTNSTNIPYVLCHSVKRNPFWSDEDGYNNYYDRLRLYNTVTYDDVNKGLYFGTSTSYASGWTQSTRDTITGTATNVLSGVHTISYWFMLKDYAQSTFGSNGKLIFTTFHYTSLGYGHKITDTGFKVQYTQGRAIGGQPYYTTAVADYTVNYTFNQNVWYHVCVKVDNTAGNGANEGTATTQLWINGVSQSLTANETNRDMNGRFPGFCWFGVVNQASSGTYGHTLGGDGMYGHLIGNVKFYMAHDGTDYEERVAIPDYNTGPDFYNEGPPNEGVSISGGVNISGGLRANGSSGTSGQVLTSSGGGAMSWTTGGSSLSGTNTFEWGTGVSGKEVNAGKIGYSTFTSGTNGALDIVGAGPASPVGTLRNVRIFDNLGIGTGSPTSPLHVIGDAFFDGGNIHFNKTSGYVSKITSSSAGDDLQFYSAKWIRFIESDTNTDKLVINGNEGKIGINHSTPDSCLHIASSSGQTITLDNTTRTSYIHYVRGNGHWYSVVDNNGNYDHNMYWYANATSDGGSTWSIKQIFRFENNVAGAGSSAIDTFTGQHMSSIVDVTPTNVSNCVGLIVSSNQNDYMTINGGTPLKGAKNIHVNEAIPVVKISTKAQDKACFGVISSGEDPNESGREQRTGRIVGVFHKESGDNRVYVNSLGEGGVWVVNTNGNLEAGDYITTSNVSGYGMKQTSEFLANYTVAKITMDCNFNPGQVPVKQIKKVSATNTYYVRSTDNDTCTETFYNTLDDETKALYTKDVRTEMVNDLDSNGVFQWEDTSETELAYTIRYLDADGIETTQENAVHIAAFVGCTYHCG